MVEVDFDSRVVSFEALLDHARDRECAGRVFTRTDRHQAVAERAIGDAAVRSDEPIRLDDEPKYYLLQSAYADLPVTELQRARVNASLDGDWRRWLSPRQLKASTAP